MLGSEVLQFFFRKLVHFENRRGAVFPRTYVFRHRTVIGTKNKSVIKNVYYLSISLKTQKIFARTFTKII